MTNREFFLQRRAMETGLFQKVFKAVPGDKLDWQPEPKARTARQLIGHLIGHEQDLVELLERGEINHRMEVPFRNVSEAVDLHQQACERAAALLSSLPDETWEGQTAAFKVGPHVIMEGPRRDLGWLLFCDAIHHRGQLSTYLRPMGSKVPSLYGPSADEMPGA